MENIQDQLSRDLEEIGKALVGYPQPLCADNKPPPYEQGWVNNGSGLNTDNLNPRLVTGWCPNKCGSRVHYYDVPPTLLEDEQTGTYLQCRGCGTHKTVIFSQDPL